MFARRRLQWVGVIRQPTLRLGQGEEETETMLVGCHQISICEGDVRKGRLQWVGVISQPTLRLHPGWFVLSGKRLK